LQKKHALAKEMLKFCFTSLKENNSPDESGSNRFSFLTLRYSEFFYAFLLMCKETEQEFFNEILLMSGRPEQSERDLFGVV